MMNFFEQELRTLTKDAGFKTGETTFAGRAAFLQIGGGRCARVELETCGTSEHYEAIKVTILSKTEGKIDCLMLRFRDYFSKNSRGQMPHIWIDRGEAEWYTKPTSAEWKSIAKATHDYIQVFA